MDWLLSGISILMLWLMGNKSRWGPIVGIVTQVLWLIYVLNTEQHGLLIGTVAYAVIHVRNLRKWNKEQ